VVASTTSVVPSTSTTVPFTSFICDLLRARRVDINATLDRVAAGSPASALIETYRTRVNARIDEVLAERGCTGTPS
jgi:hypothetical protein